MVGGSVSGRTFKPDPSSYEATGIPCGNPRRYKNRSILRMVPDKTVPFENQQVGIPGKGTPSEAEDHLKDLLKMQLETNITLHRETRKRKAFCEPVVYENSSEKARGIKTLSEYNQFDVYKKKEQELSQLGLDQEEIKLKMMDSGLYNESSKRRNYGVNPTIMHDRRKAIKEKIQAKQEQLSQETSFSNVRSMSRHAMEVEMSLNRGTEKSNTLSHLVQSQYKEDPALEAVLRAYNNKQKQEYTTHSVYQPCHSFVATYPSDQSASDKDRESEIILSLDEEVIKRHRLSVEEIRKIHRFKDYSLGSPTQVLYLKNLAKRVSEADMEALFKRFETHLGKRVEIRLMTGRMKGQAFVTFPDNETATEALNLVNGYQLYGRPIIIQYGKKEKGTEKSKSEKG